MLGKPLGGEEGVPEITGLGTCLEGKY